MIKHGLHTGPLAAALGTTLLSTLLLPLLWPQPAHACGGLFCNSTQSQAVNQAAERIIFSHNEDGTVTAVIEIMYEGAADRFAWLLPVPGVPKIEVSSSQVFDQLQRLTAPTYTLQVQVEGECQNFAFANGGSGGASFGTPTTTASDAAPSEPAVMLEASGTVGPYDFAVISLMDGLDDPAQVAIDWLTTEGYDVGELGPEVLRPYLLEGLNLLAFRLTKGNQTGSIRPVRLTYPADSPSIPIRPTAVAANDNMGVMVFMLAQGRAVPTNYRALELNEALINWFNPSSNYNDVINQAADQAGGHGFVTEFAGSTEFLRNQIFGPGQRAQWNDFQSGSFTNGQELLRQAIELYGSWDGFELALQAGVTPSDPESIETLVNCFQCPVNDELVVDSAAFVEALFDKVISPVLQTHELLTSQGKLTRLYTTMSADEMTVDPVFDDNHDLPDVDNLHQATRFIECSSEFDQSAAPWRIELPQGDVVRGMGSTLTWPVSLEAQPANLRVMQLSTSGEGEVIADNRGRVTEMLIELAGDFEVAAANTNAGGGGSGGGSVSGSPAPRGNPSESDASTMSSSGLCSAVPGRAAGGDLAWLGLGALWLVRCRRSKRSKLA
ncbi:MAG: DUF2330 domain-containing protein [Myxococcales bacterium]|nr:DUF2330 domain-containing protein [Myxococcales bacterium]